MYNQAELVVSYLIKINGLTKSYVKFCKRELTLTIKLKVYKDERFLRYSEFLYF